MKQKVDFKGIDRNTLRHRNTFSLLHLIRVNGAISQADLARQSGLSPASVSNILQPFIADQRLVETGKTERGLGRRASLLTFNPEKLLTVGIVIEPHSCEVALVSLTGDVFAYITDTRPTGWTPEHVAEFIQRSLAELLREHGLSRHALVGAGIAAPGLIDAENGVVRAASNLNWFDVAIGPLLAERLGLPCYLEHLGRAKIAVELVYGAGNEYSNIVLLEMGSGIGAGIIVDGHLLMGATHSATEVGHTSLDIDGPQCSCGLHGCWEAFCSGPAILKRIQQILAEHPATGTLLSRHSDLHDLNRAYEAGDDLARQVVQATAHYMARGLGNVIWNFDPGLIILSGKVVQDCPVLVDATQRELDGLEAFRSLDVPIVASPRHKHAGVIAAAALVSARYLETLMDPA